MKICHLHFDAKHCQWKLDEPTIQETIEMCRKLKCPHGSITEKTLKSGERIAFVTCDYSWNPFDWRETTYEERETIIF